VDDYLTALRRLAGIIQVEDSDATCNFKCVFVKHSSPCRFPETTERGCRYGSWKNCELTSPTKSSVDKVLTKQLVDVRAEVKRLAGQRSKLTTAPKCPPSQCTTLFAYVVPSPWFNYYCTL